MEEKNPLKDYIWNTGNTFDIMRLLVEGAVTLFDDEASPLFRLGRQHGQEKAACAFDATGTALFELRMHIMKLQELHGKEVGGQCKSMESDMQE